MQKKRKLQFTPEASQRLAKSVGYTGLNDGSPKAAAEYGEFLQKNPDAGRLMNHYKTKALQMAKGGLVQTRKSYQTGGLADTTAPAVAGVGTPQFIPDQTAAGRSITDESIRRTFQPSTPFGGTVTPVGTELQQGQFIDPTSGQTTGDRAAAATIAQSALAGQAPQFDATKTTAQTAAAGIEGALQPFNAAQVGQQAAIVGQEQNTSAVSNIQAAQGTAVATQNTVQRQIQAGELVSPSANAETAAAFTEQIQAAEATPNDKATVQGQLALLTQDFDAANPPQWAAGALRLATQKMVQRGIGASSIAGQAIVQAALEAATPIAQQDAAIQAEFQRQNLSNRQQRAVLSAQQRAAFIGQEFDQTFQSRVQNAARVGDIANANFTADQQIVLENSRQVHTINLSNLSNNQARIMAEAASVSQLEAGSLNNRQQAAVQNAQNFLQVDLTDASIQQQTDTFKAQQRTAATLTDAAAENASRQFNASSDNQVDQFFAQLATQTNQFNTSQTNAQQQFNAGQVNTISRFNQEVANQRDQFNAKNQVVVDQSNAVWRRSVATAATAQVNRSNELNAKAVLDISNSAYNNLWQYFSDVIEFAQDSAESDLDRNSNLAIAELTAQSRSDVAAEGRSSAAGQAVGGLISTLASSAFSAGILSDSRLKDNIQLIKRLDSGVGLFSWEWNDIAEKLGVKSKRTKGVIAQDVKKYYPDLVWKDRITGYYKVNTWKAILT
tara:strand:+ start:756 stop:2933 length:2178 start_codon:yes stop_codon:yes gene_type:complete